MSASGSAREACRPWHINSLRLSPSCWPGRCSRSGRLLPRPPALLAFAGVVVLAAEPGQSANTLPLLLVVGAAFAFAVSNILTKRYGPFDPLMLMGWSSLLTVPQVMLMSLLIEHGQLASLVTADERGWLALAYTIFIGGIVGFGLWFWLIARCSMGRVAPFGLLLPVFALISSVLFLGDRVTPKLIVGGLLAISGVAITQIRPGARPI